MSGRDANQLAADVRGIIADCQDVLSAPEVDRGMAALDELVALVGTLQQERDTLENRWLADNERAVAAEAALAEARCRLHPPGEWCNHCRSRAGA